jgi:hypothetical protein
MMLHPLETAEQVHYAGTDDKGGWLLVADKLNMDQAILRNAKGYVYHQTLKDIFPPWMHSDMNVYLEQASQSYSVTNSGLLSGKSLSLPFIHAL